MEHGLVAVAAAVVQGQQFGVPFGDRIVIQHDVATTASTDSV